MNDRSDDLLREVDEQLQWERFEKFAKQYGAYVAAGILAVILGVAGFVYWEHFQETKNQALSERFSESMLLLDKNQKKESIEKLQDLAKDPSSYGMMARFKLASLHMDDPEKRAEAIKIYREMIENRDIDRRYRSLAIILLTLAELESGDTKDLAKILQEASIGTNMWPNTTTEVSAYVEIKNGEVEQAKSILTGLKNDSNAPQGVRIRSEALLQMLQQHK